MADGDICKIFEENEYHQRSSKNSNVWNESTMFTFMLLIKAVNIRALGLLIGFQEDLNLVKLSEIVLQVFLLKGMKNKYIGKYHYRNSVDKWKHLFFDTESEK